MTLNVWTYWEGPMPKHIRLCLNSMRASCSSKCRFTILNPDNIAEHARLELLDERYWALDQPAHRADCLRALLLAQHGGLWLDADTVGLNRCPSMLPYQDVDLLYCTWTKPPRRILNGYVYASPRFACSWLDGVNETLASEKNGMPWTALGEGVLTPLVNRNKWMTLVNVPLNTFLPVDVDAEPHKLTDRLDPTALIKEHTVCFGLNNSWLVHNKRAELNRIGRRSQLLLHKLLNIWNDGKP